MLVRILPCQWPRAKGWTGRAFVKYHARKRELCFMPDQTLPAASRFASGLNFILPRAFSVFALALALAGVGLIPLPARAASDEQVQSAMNKAKDYLYKIQQPNGLWEFGGLEHDAQGGLTAIATYSLLAAGESPSSTKLTQALAYLKKLNSGNVYVLGVRAQIWAFLGQTLDVKALEAEDAEHLSALMKTAGEARGLYSYPKMPPDKYDHSISQFGVLGLWALAQDNAEVGMRTWDSMDQAWRRHQSKAGGWEYIMKGVRGEGEDTLSMTCAGVATLFITHDYVHAADERGCNGNVKDENIERGMKWIAEHFKRVSDEKPNTRDFAAQLYTFYGIERIGVASGYKYFGKADWFENGSNYLVSHQNQDGSFGERSSIFSMNVRNIPGTAFALLFLSNGNAPVIVDKLACDSLPPGSGKKPGADCWDQRPRDMFNLSHWMAAQTENPLKWNIVTLATPLPELCEAPVIYLAGSMPLSLSDGELAKLREFVEEGGMLLANADCGSKAFADSFRAACSKMFPSWEFRQLPQNHLIYTNQQFHAAKWPAKFNLLGLSNGVRELAVLAPDQDPSRIWQVPYQGNTAPYGLGADILEYATERTGISSKRKLIHFEIDPKIAATRSLRVSRLSYGGNWNPEPGAWRNMAAISHDVDKIEVHLEVVDLGHDKLKPDAYELATLTGTEPVKLAAAQWDEIKNYVNGGGTILIDAAGGSSGFADAMESGLAATFGRAGDSLSSAVPDDDPIYPPGLRDRQIFRAFARGALGESRSPRLRVMKIGGRNAVIFSREDLTNGLVGADVDGVIGYTPEAATRIVGNIILGVAK